MNPAIAPAGPGHALLLAAKPANPAATPFAALLAGGEAPADEALIGDFPVGDAPPAGAGPDLPPAEEGETVPEPAPDAVLLTLLPAPVSPPTAMLPPVILRAADPDMWEEAAERPADAVPDLAAQRTGPVPAPEGPNPNIAAIAVPVHAVPPETPAEAPPEPAKADAIAHQAPASTARTDPQRAGESPASKPESVAAMPAEHAAERGNEERPASHAPPQPAPAANTVAQNGPFRLESAPLATPLTVPGAAPAPQAAPPPAMPLPAILAETAAQMPAPETEVRVAIGTANRLDISIAAESPAIADRVEAGTAELLRDLSAIGAEVEAIRVEVRNERGPDGAELRDAARQGAGGDPRREGRDMPRVEPQQQAGAGSENAGVRITVAHGPGRSGGVDRYA